MVLWEDSDGWYVTNGTLSLGLKATQGNYHQSFHQIEYMIPVEMRVLNSCLRLSSQLVSYTLFNGRIDGSFPVQPSVLNKQPQPTEQMSHINKYKNQYLQICQTTLYNMEVVIIGSPSMQNSHDLQTGFPTGMNLRMDSAQVLIIFLVKKDVKRL